MQNSNSPLNRKDPRETRRRSTEESVTEGADTRYNPHTRNNETLIIYQREIVLRINKKQENRGSPPKRKKKDIQRFSRKSRLRMLRKFNRLQTAQLTEPLFITLTSRNHELDPEEFRYRFLKMFLPKLKKIIPGLCFCWRLEFHESGYPHIHMFAWSFQTHRNLHSQFYKRPIRRVWRNIIGDNSRAAELYACKIKEVGSFRKAIFYVAKYTAKEEEEENTSLTGRRWAMSKNFPANPITEIPLRREQAKVIREIAKSLQRKRERNGAKPFEITGDETEIFLWLDPEQISGILASLNKFADKNKFERVTSRGSPDWTEAELAQFAKDAGYDY